MSKIKIITDSAGNLPVELMRRYNIEVVPFHINMDGTLVMDSPEITSKKLFEFVKKTDKLPGTVACSLESYFKMFSKWVERDSDIICVTISSELSASYQNAKIVSGEFGGKVRVVDSRSLSSGQGLVTMAACEMAEKGADAEEIERELGDVVQKVKAGFVLDTLSYMRKGGRCTSIELLGANLLKIKPQIGLSDGKMSVIRKFRGNMVKVIKEYVEVQLAESPPLQRDKIFVTHTECEREIVEAAMESIRENADFNQIYETDASSVIACHSGPNTLGILYI